MDAHGVKVLHGAHGDHVAVAVAHDLELDLFPAGDAALHQDLGDGTQAQAGLADALQVGLVVADTAAAAARVKAGRTMTG